MIFFCFVPCVLFSDLEIDADFNSDDYELEDEAKLVIFPDYFEIALPNIEELPALVSSFLYYVVSFLMYCKQSLLTICFTQRQPMLGIVHGDNGLCTVI